ncbi:MAG: response regulator [Thermodesulfobacteriota bacterium]
MRYSVMTRRDSILVVDDKAAIREVLSLMMRSMGFEVQAADCSATAVNLFKKRPFDLVLTDFNMPGMDGSDLARCLKRILPTTPVVLVTDLVKWIGILFPECEIHVHQGPYVPNPYESSCDNKIVKLYLIREKSGSQP